MKQLTNAEVERWLNGLAAMDKHNEIIAMTIATTFGIPPSMLDVGSGDGALANMFRKIGCDAYGVDLLPRPAWPHLLQRDLEQPIDLGRQYDLVTCIEVAEHLRPQAADTLCDTILKHTAPNGLVVFTAAMPGQPGDGHVNCQPAEYWRKRMHERGLWYRADHTYHLALALSIANHPLHWVEANLQIFWRKP